MWRRWVWIMAIGLVLAGGRWESATGQTFDLTKLKSVCVRTKFYSTKSNEKTGLNEEAIGNHVYVLLKAKLPRLKVARYAGKDTGLCSTGDASILWVYVNIDIGHLKGGEVGGYYGAVEISVWRPTLWESGNSGVGIAYENSRIMLGPLNHAKQAVNDSLDALIIDFAAEYYKAGNP